MSDIPVGTIVMYSGTTMPAHWLLCDGKNNTPDLRDRFILGGELNDIGGKSSEKTTGDKDKKHFELNTNESSSTITVKVKEHSLTVDELPEHDHEFRVPSGRSIGHATECDSGVHAVPLGYDSENDKPYITKTGKNKGHMHDAHVDVTNHRHSADVTAPYYILAFIMYQGN
jgi:microcystin-dependent protein